MKQYDAYIFDMDGTVLNTMDDLKDAVNHSMEKTGHRHDYDGRTTGLLFGSAVKVALTRALLLEEGVDERDLVQVGTPADTLSERIDEAEVDKILEIYKPYYQIHCNDKTRPYDGIMELVRALKRDGRKSAVVSNKPDPAVQKLNEDHFGGIFDYAIGESPAYARKPAPDMVWKALEVLGVKAENAVYIGDTEVDLETAARCGMDCIAVTWGFRPRYFLEERGAECIVERPDEIYR